jgi:hypothetical protein
MISDADARKIAEAIESERVRRKCLVDSWMDGAFSSQELHEILNREQPKEGRR